MATPKVKQTPAQVRAKAKAKANGKPKRKPGRPKGTTLHIDWDLVDSLCDVQCTLIEIAGIIGCCDDTIVNRCKQEKGMNFKDYYESKSAPGKMSIRRAQFKAANEGNPTMLIWLGKQCLGQRDKNDLAVSGNLSHDATVEELAGD